MLGKYILVFEQHCLESFALLGREFLFDLGVLDGCSDVSQLRLLLLLL